MAPPRLRHPRRGSADRDAPRRDISGLSLDPRGARPASPTSSCDKHAEQPQLAQLQNRSSPSMSSYNEWRERRSSREYMPTIVAPEAAGWQ
jgi:hypothetical protein